MRSSTEDFVKKACIKHPGRYSYENVKYVNWKTKVYITCLVEGHGEFLQRPNDHLNGQGCPLCAKILRAESRSKSTLMKRAWPKVQPLGYKLIPLSSGHFAKVDNEDFDFLSRFAWQYSKGYAKNDLFGLMHRHILPADKSLQVDHINRDGLDNRRKNLRIAKPYENASNQRGRDGYSKYKGVCWSKAAKKWVAYITSRGVTKHIGCFLTEQEAAQARDKRALELHGDFAYINLQTIKEEGNVKRTR